MRTTTAGEELSAMQSPPAVSVIIANYNGAAFLVDAVGSACRQSLRNIEIIVSDDASTDNSIEIVTRLMSQDPRIRLLTSDRNCGPAATRNRALAAATGEWIAVLDHDDLMHPDRLAVLVAAGAKDGADIVADDLLMFDNDHSATPQTLLRGRWARDPFWLDMERYIRMNIFFGRGPVLGYLKPVVRSSLLAEANVHYDERLRVAEDFDFVLRLLHFGARFRVYPLLLYFYRRHSGSISHRLTPAVIGAIKTVDRERSERLRLADKKVAAAMKSRTRSIDTALAFDRLVDAIKRRDLIAVGLIVMQAPQALMLLRHPIVARLNKLRRTAPIKERRDRRKVCIVTRQRVIGPTNGSSTYLLELAGALARQGLEVHLLSPSPTTLGRWPYLALRNEMSVFSTIHVRGTCRIGRHLVAVDPRRYVQGLIAVAEKLMLRAGLIARPVLRPAPYANAEPLTRKDQLFIAKHVPKVGDVLIADYCFLTGAFPYALRPDATTAVIMHDLFSSRARQFAALGSSDATVTLTEAEECALLAKADAIVAIQREEAEFLKKRIPGARIIVAPMAARPVEAPRLGRADQLLFVGSSAAPNVDGLRWFLESCWPMVRAERPTAVLRVAGTVCQKVGRPPAAVELLGLVDDLAPLYADAGIIISPLRVGSGLKIKLIEALAEGKAVVATSVTLQGVTDILHDCVRVADEPEQFVTAILDLVDDERARTILAARGLMAAKRYFSADSCYREFVEAMMGMWPRQLAPALDATAEIGMQHEH